jgi:Tol biopolymer transport system component
MRHSHFVNSLALLPLVLAASIAPAQAQAPRIELVSRGAFPAPVPSNGDSSNGGVSADGRYLVFDSRADNLGVVDSNGVTDVYLLDRSTNLLTVLSRNGATASNAASFTSVISADGSTVAFGSDATTLVAGDSNGFVDIFIANRATGALTRLVVPGGAEPNGNSGQPTLSADGRYVAFFSEASNWVAGDSNGASDIFVYDRTAGTVVRASVGAAGEQLSASAGLFDIGGFPSFSISGDGRCVAFGARDGLVPGDLNMSRDIFLRDLVAGTTTRVTQTATLESNSDSDAVVLDATCSRAVFSTFATNLHPDAILNYQSIVLEKDLVSGAITRIAPASIATAPVPPAFTNIAAAPNFAHIAVGGEVFGFGDTTPLLLWRRSDNSLTPSPIQGSPFGVPDGAAFVVFTSNSPIQPADRNAYTDVGLFDMVGGGVVQVSTPASPRISNAANGASGLGNRDSKLQTAGSTRMQFVSDDGTLIAYTSLASNLIASDAEGIEDVFVANRRTGTNQRISVTPLGAGGNGDSVPTDMTPDGRYVVFDSCASNLVAGDTNSVCDLFLADRSTTPPTIERINISSAGVQADLSGPGSNNADVRTQGIGNHWGSISHDGRYVAFASAATNLVAGDSNNRSDIFLRDRVLGTTIKLTQGVGGVGTSNRSEYPRISGDGRVVVFRSAANNLVTGAVGQQNYAITLPSLAVEVVSLGNDDLPAGGANRPFVSFDGRYVGFLSTSSTVVPGDTNSDNDVFVRDRLLGKTTRATLRPDGTEFPSGTQPFIGGLSSRGLLIPFTVNVGDGFGNEGYSYNIATGKVDLLYAAPPGFSQSLRLFASANGRFVVYTHSGQLTAADENGPIYDIYLSSEFTSTAAGGAEGAAPELALQGAPEVDAEMGDAVAVSEKYLVVGAPGTNEVYVYARPAGATATTMMNGIATAKNAKDFSLLGTLQPPAGGLPGDKWGSAVDISDDGTRIVIGVPGVDQGQVVVFDEPLMGWGAATSPSVTIPAPPPSGNAAPDDFGTSVALADDGRIVVGAPTTDVGGQTDAGMAAVYTPFGGSYPTTPSQMIQAAAPQSGAGFGMEVEATSNAVAVGAPLQDGTGGTDIGMVYTYGSTGGTQYTAAGTVPPPNGGAPGDKWGAGIGLDGNTLAIGAPGMDIPNMPPDTGAGYVYESPSGNFTAVSGSLLLPSRALGGEGMGTSVELEGDYIAMGAPTADRINVADSGTAFIFEQPELGWNTRTSHQATIELRPSEAQVDQLFGADIALTTQGVLAGVPDRDVAGRADQGESDTFVFDRILRAGME